MTSREQLQALIRAEIDRQHPVAVARRTLELLAESATRRLDAPPGYQIVDRDGQPRTRIVGGETLPLSLSDLVDELRRQHPTMFQQPAAPPPAASGGAPRDWIVVKPAPAAPRPPARPSRLREALDGLAARLRRPAPAPQGPVAAAVPVPAGPTGEGLKPGLARPQRRLGRWSSHRGAFAVLGGLVVLGIGSALLRDGGEPAREAAIVAPAPAQGTGPRTSQAADVRPEARPAEAKPAETKPAPAAVPSKAAETKREPVQTGAVVPETAGPLAGVAEVLDTATLRLGGRTLRLYGVEWAKGAQASDLSGYLAGRPVNCQPSPAKTAWICTVDGHDLSEVVLYNGGGRAGADATPDLVEAERHARTGKLGIWAKQP
ncbi:thermonuclease family protein [Methylobacterium aquaticum]|uniref:thermonuclease family protein n=1 Tax=Methylobacterium aquaticum TaxID=270351 RepID=UPI003D174B7D